MADIIETLRAMLRAELFPVHDAIDRLELRLDSRGSAARPAAPADDPAPEARPPGPLSSAS